MGSPYLQQHAISCPKGPRPTPWMLTGGKTSSVLGFGRASKNLTLVTNCATRNGMRSEPCAGRKHCRENLPGDGKEFRANNHSSRRKPESLGVEEHMGPPGIGSAMLPQYALPATVDWMPTHWSSYVLADRGRNIYFYISMSTTITLPILYHCNLDPTFFSRAPDIFQSQRPWQPRSRSSA